MKFAGRDAPQDPETTIAPAMPGRRRGLLEASDPDGSWGHVGISLFKTVAITGLAALCWQFVPSFEGWSFGDRFPNGKIGFAPTILSLAFAVGGVINLYATMKSALIAIRG